MLSRVSVPQIICDAEDGAASALPAEVDFGIEESDVPGTAMLGTVVLTAPEVVVAHPTSKAVEAATVPSSQSRFFKGVIVLRRMAGHQASVDDNIIWVRTSGFVELSTARDQP